MGGTASGALDATLGTSLALLFIYLFVTFLMKYRLLYGKLKRICVLQRISSNRETEGAQWGPDHVLESAESLLCFFCAFKHGAGYK